MLTLSEPIFPVFTRAKTQNQYYHHHIKAKIRYTDTCYVVHQQWSKGGEPATFPLIQQYLRRRQEEQQQEQRKLSEPAAAIVADPTTCRCSKSESLLNERKTRRRRSRSQPGQPTKSPSTSSLSTDDETNRSAARKQQANVAVADVHHRVNSTVDTADGTNGVKGPDNGSTERFDINHNRVCTPNRADSSAVSIRRRQFFEPISDWSTSTSVDESSDGGGGGGGDGGESSREDAAYEMIEFRTEVREANLMKCVHGLSHSFGSVKLWLYTENMHMW